MIAPQPTIKSLFLEGPAGRLEALLNAGSEDATHAAIVCHPHPLFGGTLHNKVVFHTMKALNSFGFPVLRFNFRGAGTQRRRARSRPGGSGRCPHRSRLAGCGVSFAHCVRGILFRRSSWIARCLCRRARESVIGVGVPAIPVAADSEAPRTYTFDFLSDCVKPKLFVSGATRSVRSPAETRSSCRVGSRAEETGGD